MTARPSLAPTAASFAAQIPYAFAKAHGVLAAGMEGDAVVVLTRPDATVDGIAEIRRVLQKSLVTRAVAAEEFAAELARAYNQGSPTAATTWADDLARETDLTRLMQDVPVTEDLLDSSTQAPVIRMINALLLQALRERASDLHFEPYEGRSVVRSDAQGRKLTSERYDYIMNEQEQNVGKPLWFWNGQTTPPLPPEGVMPGTPASVPPEPPPKFTPPPSTPPTVTLPVP